jgi:hypothetical protein
LRAIEESMKLVGAKEDVKIAYSGNKFQDEIT